MSLTINSLGLQILAFFRKMFSNTWEQSKIARFQINFGHFHGVKRSAMTTNFVFCVLKLLQTFIYICIAVPFYSSVCLVSS